jgi:hypothetical protein
MYLQLWNTEMSSILLLMVLKLGCTSWRWRGCAQTCRSKVTILSHTLSAFSWHWNANRNCPVYFYVTRCIVKQAVSGELRNDFAMLPLRAVKTLPPWRRKQHMSLKRWYLRTRLHIVTTQNIMYFIMGSLTYHIFVCQCEKKATCFGCMQPSSGLFHTIT